MVVEIAPEDLAPPPAPARLPSLWVDQHPVAVALRRAGNHAVRIMRFYVDLQEAAGTSWQSWSMHPSLVAACDAYEAGDPDVLVGRWELYP